MRSSQNFLHQTLLDRGAKAMRTVLVLWDEDRRIKPSLLLWTDEAVTADTGDLVSGVIYAELSVDPERRDLEIRVAVAKYEPFGVLLVVQHTACVSATLESPYGSRVWTLPIIKRGSNQTLGVAHVQDLDGTTAPKLLRY